MRRLILSALLLPAVLLLAACVPTENPPAAGTSTAGIDPNASGYPGPENLYEPPYPIEGFDRETFEQSVTPNAPPPSFSADTGAMTIRLAYPDGSRPVRGQLFFAAGTIPVQGVDEAFIPALDAETAPSGHSDNLGVLVISEIPPGKYALTLMTPLGPILVENAETDEPIVFEITANTLTDLGGETVFLNAETLEP